MYLLKICPSAHIHSLQSYSSHFDSIMILTDGPCWLVHVSFVFARLPQLCVPVLPVMSCHVSALKLHLRKVVLYVLMGRY